MYKTLLFLAFFLLPSYAFSQTRQHVVATVVIHQSLNMERNTEVDRSGRDAEASDEGEEVTTIKVWGNVEYGVTPGEGLQSIPEEVLKKARESGKPLIIQERNSLLRSIYMDRGGEYIYSIYGS